MLLHLLLDASCQSVIAALGHSGPLRFSELQRRAHLDNKTLSIKIKELRSAMVVVARTIPSKGERIWLEYRLTPRGEAMFAVLEDLRKSLNKNRVLAGAAKEFEQVFLATSEVV